MTSPIPTVEAELREVIAANPENMGQVYALLEEGKTSNAELVEAGAILVRLPTSKSSSTQS